MILTLSWKEYREHRAIWFTMVLMTGVLAYILPLLAPGGGASISGRAIPAMALLGMAATYGVVCGSMMFAGEREGGTMVLFDIFLGRRGLLWIGKFLLGVVFVVTEALAVAAVMGFLKQDPPDWVLGIAGRGIGRDEFRAVALGFTQAKTSPSLWYVVLPVVTLEAYAWGLLGSSLSRRVLTGAALAALIAAPVWLVAVFMPPSASLGLRLVSAGVALFLSCNIFLTQSRDAPSISSPLAEEPEQPPWVEIMEELCEVQPSRAEPPAMPILLAEAVPAEQEPVVKKKVFCGPRPPQAGSPMEVLLWLSIRQGWIVLAAMAGLCLVVGPFLPFSGQMLWPLATLLLGVACGTAAFAQEQSDLSYQFLSSQHFPLKTIWNLKILFWLAVAMVVALLAVGIGFLAILLKYFVEVSNRPRGMLAGAIEPVVMAGFNLGSLEKLLGPVLYFGMWLIYGFGTGQLFVWLCRKPILAVLLSTLVSLGALSLWMPSLLCGGMGGWQVWLAPVGLLLTTRLLVRAWAGGRIKERRLLAGLAGFAVLALIWVGVNCLYRAWEIPDAVEPLDRKAYQKSLGKANPAGQKIQEALGELEKPDGREGPWRERLAEASRMPLGIVEMPAGGLPRKRHLEACHRMADRLRGLGQTDLADGNYGGAFNQLALMLAFSRHLRNKALMPSYLTGVHIEQAALKELDHWLAQRKPDAGLLRRMVRELDRHAAQTPPALDCLHRECFRARELLKHPAAWTMNAGPAAGGIPERWLAGWIALSLDTVWEKERHNRLWRVVWAGLFRAMEKPFWLLPDSSLITSQATGTKKQASRNILEGWLPEDEPDAPARAERLGRLLDDSWLADELLFARVVPLRSAANRGRWRVDAHRLALALALYQMEEKKPAQKLADLVPNYLPDLPVDSYSGQAFRYRLSAGEKLELEPDAPARDDLPHQPDAPAREIRPGQGILWSTGPDRVDHGGLKQGDGMADDDPRWQGARFDLITAVPYWP